MEFSEEQLQSLARKIEERERRARRVAWVVTVIPIILAGLLLAYTIRQISARQAELDQKNKDVNQITTQLDSANTTMEALNTKVPEAKFTLVALETTKAQLQSDYSQALADLATATIDIGQAQEILNAGQSFAGNDCPIAPEVIKEYSGSNSPQAQMLLFLLEMQYRGIPWNPSGFSETDGFDSPNFAIYALQNNYVESSNNYEKDNLPWRFLPAISWPENGDIVYYKSGYTMFYFELPISYSNPKTRPCVIGMTPLGILSQKMEFAEWAGFLRVPYLQ